MNKHITRFIGFIIILVSTAIVLAIAVVFSCLITKCCNDSLWTQILNVAIGVLTGCLTTWIFIVISSCHNEIHIREHIQSEITDMRDTLKLHGDLSNVELDSDSYKYIELFYRNLTHEIDKMRYRKDALQLCDKVLKLLEFQYKTHTGQDIKEALIGMFQVSDNLIK